jgi:alanine racemase
MSRGTTAIIKIDHLKHNFEVLSQLAPAKLVLVVKADAYGHGLKQIVKALDKADCFGVATIDEAMLVRSVRSDVRILLLEGFLNTDELKTAFDHNIDCVIHQNQQLDMLDAIDTAQQMNIWLKYDSGMNRLGFNDSQYSQALARLNKHKKVQSVVLMSHLATADIKHNRFTRKQTQKFLKFKDQYQDKSKNSTQLSLSNSSALLNGDNLADEWCRVGLALFGVSPIAKTIGADYGLKPVMTLKTNVIATRQVKSGQGIGYGQNYVAQKDLNIAIIGIGYGDGFPWALSSAAFVSIHGQQAQIVGRVSMDMIAIDISHIRGVKLGDAVLIWGDDAKSQLPLETLASHAQTIPYVLLCQITSRVHYRYDRK